MDNYYVYSLDDPRIDEPFYIGKGKNKRMYDHLKSRANQNSKKTKRIQEIRNAGFEPKITVWHKDLTEARAYDIETTLIKKYGREDIDPGGTLTNNRLYGWAPVMTKDVREKISKSRQGIQFSATHKNKLSSTKKGKTWEEIYGVEGAIEKRTQNQKPKGPMDEERKLNISNAKKGKAPHRWTDESKAKLRQSIKGKKITEKQKQKLREYAARIVTCPHCGKSGSGPSMQRWHFHNCKGNHV